MQNQETQMLGIPAEKLESSFHTAYNINMRLAGMLSDAQHLIEIGATVEANQVLNQVKYYFFEYTDTRNLVHAQKNS